MVIVNKIDKYDNVEERSHYGIDDQDRSGSISSKESLVGQAIPMTQDLAVWHKTLFIFSSSFNLFVNKWI